MVTNLNSKPSMISLMVYFKVGYMLALLPLEIIWNLWILYIWLLTNIISIITLNQPEKHSNLVLLLHIELILWNFVI